MFLLGGRLAVGARREAGGKSRPARGKAIPVSIDGWEGLGRGEGEYPWPRGRSDQRWYGRREGEWQKTAPWAQSELRL